MNCRFVLDQDISNLGYLTEYIYMFKNKTQNTYCAYSLLTVVCSIQYMLSSVQTLTGTYQHSTIHVFAFFESNFPVTQLFFNEGIPVGV